MIERVLISNYRSIKQADVNLGDLCVLVGRNGAGKSTFIDAIRLIRDALKFNLETAIDTRGGIKSLGSWTPAGRPRAVEFGLVAAWDDNCSGELAVTVARSHDNGYEVKREWASARYPVFVLVPDDEEQNYVDHYLENEIMEISDGIWKSGYPDNIYPTGRSEPLSDPLSLQLSAQLGFNPGLNDLRRHLQRMTFYAIFPNTLREPQKPTSETILNEHGGNLSSALKQIISQDIWKMDLVAAMRRLVGDIVDVRVRTVGGYQVTELKHEAFGKGDKWLNLAQESDGTLRMLGLLVALYQDPSPSMIVIEEPELTIHPGALAVLSDILREASQRTQILVTTQSPDLVSYFKAHEIRVADRVGGVTEIGMIDEAQRAAIEQHLFTGGELLRMEDLRRSIVAAGSVSE